MNSRDDRGPRARRLCIRFDVDSRRGLDVGVPNLLRLGGALGVRFTFFVHPGRMTDRPLVAAQAVRSRVLRGSGPGGHPAGPGAGDGGAGQLPGKLALRRKLGTAGWLRVAALNPPVGAGAPDRITEIAAAGHEVGLHGGRNHRRWQSTAATWPPQRTAGELDHGLSVLAAAGVRHVAGFASPGWTTPPGLAPVLAERGFAYVADRRAGLVQHDPSGLVDIPTRILGEPRGVGYLEWLRATGVDDDLHAIADLHARLADHEAATPTDQPVTAVLYDHPFWAGIADLERLGRLVVAAQDAGWEIVTMADVAEAAQPAGAASSTDGARGDAVSPTSPGRAPAGP